MRPKTYRRCEYPVFEDEETREVVERMAFGYLIGIFQDHKIFFNRTTGEHIPMHDIKAVVEHENGTIGRYEPNEIKIIHAKA